MKILVFVLIAYFMSVSYAQTTDPALAPPTTGNLEVRPPDQPGQPGQLNPPPPPGGGGLAPPAVPGSPGSQGVVQPTPDQGQGTNAGDSRTILQGIFEDYRYEPEGKRDPFMPYNAPKAVADCGPFEECADSDLRRFDLDQLRLVGIIWDVKTPRAMFVDPSQKTHMVSEQDKIGRNNGYVAEIREGELVVIEKFYNLGRFTYQTRVLKLQKE